MFLIAILTLIVIVTIVLLVAIAGVVGPIAILLFGDAFVCIGFIIWLIVRKFRD